MQSVVEGAGNALSAFLFDCPATAAPASSTMTVAMVPLLRFAEEDRG